MIQPMKEKIRKKLFRQRKLLNNSSAEFRESSYVFPASEGGLRRLGSLKRRFSQLREFADIPTESRPNLLSVKYDCFNDAIRRGNLSRSHLPVRTRTGLTNKPPLCQIVYSPARGHFPLTVNCDTLFRIFYLFSFQLGFGLVAAWTEHGEDG